MFCARKGSSEGRRCTCMRRRGEEEIFLCPVTVLLLLDLPRSPEKPRKEREDRACLAKGVQKRGRQRRKARVMHDDQGNRLEDTGNRTYNNCYELETGTGEGTEMKDDLIDPLLARTAAVTSAGHTPRLSFFFFLPVKLLKRRTHEGLAGEPKGREEAGLEMQDTPRGKKRLGLSLRLQTAPGVGAAADGRTNRSRRREAHEQNGRRGGRGKGGVTAQDEARTV